MLIGKDFVFVHIPKNAGTFVRGFLERQRMGRSLEQWHLPIRQIPHKHKRKRRIAIIRNPLDYYVSIYSYQRAKPNRPNDRWYNIWPPYGEFKDFMRSMFDDEANQKIRNMKVDLALGRSVPHRVIDWMLNMDVGLYTIRYMYMCYETTDILKTEKDKIYDFEFDYGINEMLKCETLMDDMRRAFFLSPKQMQNIQNTKKSNVSQKRYNNSLDYYDQELIDLVRHKDRLIFKKHGY